MKTTILFPFNACVWSDEDMTQDEIIDLIKSEVSDNALDQMYAGVPSEIHIDSQGVSSVELLVPGFSINSINRLTN